MQVQAKRKKAKNTGLKVGAAIVGLVAVAVLLALTVGKDDDDDVAAPGTEVPVDTTAAPDTTVAPEPGEPSLIPFTYGEGECPAADGSSPVTKTFDAAPQLCIDPAKAYTATFDTTEGEIVVALDTARTPGTVNNFVTLSRWGYYDETIIFRTDPSIDIIQGGGTTNTDNPGYEIPDEGTGFTYTEGDLVMARTGAPNSAGGQFFFATGPLVSLLDGQGTYVTFGRTVEGLDVLKTIIGLHEAQPDNPLGGAPSREVKINSVTITEA